MLEEMSLALADSLQTDHIAARTVAYARRFLGAEGAALVQAGSPDGLRVAAAEGTLAPLAGAPLDGPGESVVHRCLAAEQPVTDPGPGALGAVPVGQAAAAPLRAHGVTLGVLVVTGPPEGIPGARLRLLPTVATHAAVGLANSRYFDMIRRAKEEWVTAFDALAEGIAVVDPTGRILRTNQALSEMLGAPIQALIGQPLAGTAVVDSEAARAVVAAAHRGERPAPVLARSEGLGRVLRLTTAPLGGPADAGPAGLPIVILIEDATERSRLEAELIQKEKLAAVGQMVSGVAHELNNPLTSIAGLSEFLLQHSAAASAEREHLRVIHQQAERAGRIVRNLLTFARTGGHEKVRVDLNDLATRTLLLMQHELRMREVSLDHHLAPEPAEARADAYEMQQVLLNLLTNAVQALEAGPAGRRLIRVTTARGAGDVMLAVEDSGPGIPEEHLPRIFTPFFTTKDPGVGTGLGLSISYGIVQSHQGRLEYFPSALGGAGFRMTLPVWS